MNGSSTAASSAMMASTHTISSKVKPRWPASLIALLVLRRGAFQRDVGGDTGAAFLTVGAVRHDVVRAVRAGRTVDIPVVPGIVGNVAAPQIRPVPGSDARCRPHQRLQS